MTCEIICYDGYEQKEVRLGNSFDEKMLVWKKSTKQTPMLFKKHNILSNLVLIHSTCN